MGNIVSSIILHPFQRQDTLFNILFKPDEFDAAADLMAGPDEDDEQVQNQHFPLVHHFPELEINFHHQLPILNNDNNNFNNPDLIIDPSKEEIAGNKNASSETRFCQITRIKTNCSKPAKDSTSNEIMEKRIGHIAVWFGDQMIVWGGYNDRSGRDHRYLSPDQLWVYDSVTNKWSNKKGNERLVPVTDMPRGTSGATACLLDQNMFIFGGYTERGNVNTLYRVNLSPLRKLIGSKSYRVSPQITFEQVCVRSPDMSPMACDKCTSWAYDGKLYIFGGYGYEPSAKLLRQLPSGVKFLLDFASERGERGWNNQLACYDPLSNEWSYPSAKGEWPSPRAAHAAALVGSDVFIFGGRHGADRMNDLWKLDMETMTWSQIQTDSSKSPEGRSWHSLTSRSSSELVLYGGLSRFRAPLCDCWIYSILNNSWTKVITNARIPRLWHTAVYSTVDDEILIYGGGFDDLFNHNLGDIYTNDLLSLRFSPESLFKLSLESVAKNIAIPKNIKLLEKEVPKCLSKIIEQKAT